MSAMAIWERGIRLAEAPYHFAPNTLRAQHDAPEIATPFSETTDIYALAAEIVEKSKRQKILAALRQLHDASARFSAQLGTHGEMIERLLQSLQNRKLIAYGFRIPRNANSEPEQIPPDLFQRRYVKWAASSISGAGLEFVSVRVLRPKWIKETNARLAQLPKPEPVAPKRRLPGRPSSKDAINAAIQSLTADGKLPNADTRKENITIVRARVHTLFPGQFPGDKGLKEETIGKYLALALPRP